MQAIALAGAGLERLATEIRHLARTELSEAREPFAAGQKGSSAMPHKRNPIKTEQITGLARLLRGYAQAAVEDVALWHERDISHSSVERIVLPDATILLDHMQRRMLGVIRGLVVDATRMRENLDLTYGALFSQRLLLALVGARIEPRRRLPRCAAAGSAGARHARAPARAAGRRPGRCRASIWTRSSTSRPTSATRMRSSSVSTRSRDRV